MLHRPHGPASRLRVLIAVAVAVVAAVLGLFAGGLRPPAIAPQPSGLRTSEAPTEDPKLASGPGPAERRAAALPPTIEDLDGVSPPGSAWDTSPVPGRVDLFIRDPSGRGLLDPATCELRPALSHRVQVRLVPGGARPQGSMASVSPEVVTLAPETPIAGLEAGWYAAFDRPPVRTHVALCFGEWVVAAEPIPPAEDRVVLVVEPEAIAAMQCTVVGRLDDEAPLVRVRPLSASGEPLAPVLATGSEGAFEIRAVPPGRVRLEVGVDEGVMTRALLTQTPRVTGMKSISLGSRVEDLEQWEHRLAVLSSIEAPFVRTVLELVPGERRDLGSITYAPAGAVLLALVDGAGTPMDSTGVLARAIPKAGDLPSAPVNWTFENQVLLFPLALEPVEFYLERGGLGTRVGVLPTGLIPGSTPSVQTVVMEPSPSSAPPRPDRP